jgi:hypothetical protein
MYDPCDEGFAILAIVGGLQQEEKAKLYDLFFVKVIVVL